MSDRERAANAADEASADGAEPVARGLEPGARGSFLSPSPDNVARVCEVTLDEFEGPLDLLLHLVRRHELDILDIPIAFVCEKYLEYIEFMRALDLEVAGDYLVMAATLAYLKSRELVPQHGEDVAGEEGSDEEGPDPREQLIARLLEYQKFKEAADRLDARPIYGRDTFGRGQDVELPPVDAGLAPITLFRLAEAYQRVLDRARILKSHEVMLETISVAERMQQLTAVLIEKARFDFEGLFLGKTWSSEGELRSLLVVTLMSILELVRMGIASVHQPLGGDAIMIERVASPEQAREALAGYDEASSFGVRAEGQPEPRAEDEEDEGLEGTEDDAGEAADAGDATAERSAAARPWWAQQAQTDDDEPADGAEASGDAEADDGVAWREGPGVRGQDDPQWASDGVMTEPVPLSWDDEEIAAEREAMAWGDDEIPWNDPEEGDAEGGASADAERGVVEGDDDALADGSSDDVAADDEDAAADDDDDAADDDDDAAADDDAARDDDDAAADDAAADDEDDAAADDEDDAAADDDDDAAADDEDDAVADDWTVAADDALATDDALADDASQLDASAQDPGPADAQADDAEPAQAKPDAAGQPERGGPEGSDESP